MDSRLKQRLIGAAVLVALAVIFLPLLVQGPAPDSGVSDVPLSMPDTPRSEVETRDLPLLTPGNTPDGGAVGMDPGHPAAASDTSAPIVDAVSAALARQTTPLAETTSTGSQALQAPSETPIEMFPAPTAGGDYAVNFGAYATTAAADAVVGSLRESKLPGYRESTTANGKTAWRVRIGPYASRADAEAARLLATHVHNGVDTRVVALDAQVATPMPTPASATTKPIAPPKPSATPTPAPAVVTAPASASKPAEPPKPAAIPATTDTGFAIQLAAFTKPDDATALRDKLRAAGFTAFTESVTTDKGTLTRVRAGPVVSRAEAEQLKAQVKAKLGLDGIVRPHP